MAARGLGLVKLSVLECTEEKGGIMEILLQFWGLSLNQTILLVAALLVVVDFFVPTDLPTHIAYVLLCALVGINIHAHVLIKLLCALLAWFALVAFHYCFWRTMVQKIVNTFIAPDRFKSGAEALVGSEGSIRQIDGNSMVKVNGDLWPCHRVEDTSDGTKVTIVGVTDGVLEVKQTIRGE